DGPLLRFGHGSLRFVNRESLFPPPPAGLTRGGRLLLHRFRGGAQCRSGDSSRASTAAGREKATAASSLSFQAKSRVRSIAPYSLRSQIDRGQGSRGQRAAPLFS